MMNMLIFTIGALVALFGLVGYVLSQRPGAGMRMSVSGLWVALLVGGGLIAASGSFFYAEPGHSYLVQYAWGTQRPVLRPGYQFYFWGDVIDFNKVVTVRLTDDQDDQSDTATTKDNSVLVRFNDSVRANISSSTRFRLPEDAERFHRLALDYRSQENLVQSSLVPVTREVIRNAARELSAQSYVTGQGGLFETNILDQMEKGIVVLRVVDIPGPITGQDSLITEGAQLEEIRKTEQDRGVRTSQQTYQRVERVRNDDGSLARKAHPIADYGILITQSTVENVSFEEMFQQMLAKQRDAAAKAAVSRQEAKQAEYEKQKVMAEGETEKAKIKMQQEKTQVERLIAAETMKKEQEILLDTAEIEKRRVEVEAQALLARADAEAKARKLKMAADGALEQKLDAWVQINGAYAEAFAQQPVVPGVVIGGDGGHGGPASAADFMNLMTAMSARQLSLEATIDR